MIVLLILLLLFGGTAFAINRLWFDEHHSEWRFGEKVAVVSGMYRDMQGTITGKMGHSYLVRLEDADGKYATSEWIPVRRLSSLDTMLEQGKPRDTPGTPLLECQLEYEE